MSNRCLTCGMHSEENKVLKARIAELEAEEQLFNKTFDAQQAEIEELRAESARLREASERVLSALLPGKVVHMGHEHVRYSATYSIAGWNPVLELQALLGGGENE